MDQVRKDDDSPEFIPESELDQYSTPPPVVVGSFDIDNEDDYHISQSTVYRSISTDNDVSDDDDEDDEMQHIEIDDKSSLSSLSASQNRVDDGSYSDNYLFDDKSSPSKSDADLEAATTTTDTNYQPVVKSIVGKRFDKLISKLTRLDTSSFTQTTDKDEQCQQLNVVPHQSKQEFLDKLIQLLMKWKRQNLHFTQKDNQTLLASTSAAYNRIYSRYLRVSVINIYPLYTNGRSYCLHTTVLESPHGDGDHQQQPLLPQEQSTVVYNHLLNHIPPIDTPLLLVYERLPIERETLKTGSIIRIYPGWKLNHQPNKPGFVSQGKQFHYLLMNAFNISLE